MTPAAWPDGVLAELDLRAATIRAIGDTVLPGVGEDAAAAAVTELAGRIGARFVGVYRLVDRDRLEPLARWNPTDGLLVGGASLTPGRSRYLVRRAREGAWVERVTGPEPDEPSDRFWAAQPDIAAGAPIHVSDDLVGLLSIGTVHDEGAGPGFVQRARLLASAIDYASALGVMAGPAIADRRDAARERRELRRVLASRRFFPVYQPIVDLRSREVVGQEALTRFTDGTLPDVRFARAAAVGLGFDFELAAIEEAIASAPKLEGDAFLAVNVSPALVMSAPKRLKRAILRRRSAVVLEITEHAPILDYEQFRWAIGRLGNVGVSIDDAGASYGSLRHIIEVGPAWVKLDMSLVRNIDTDPLRQALVAGLAYLRSPAGPRIIAEGVEREAEAQWLLGIGVEFAQGFLVGRPERAKP